MYILPQKWILVSYHIKTDKDWHATFSFHQVICTGEKFKLNQIKACSKYYYLTLTYKKTLILTLDRWSWWGISIIYIEHISTTAKEIRSLYIYLSEYQEQSCWVLRTDIGSLYGKCTAHIVVVLAVPSQVKTNRWQPTVYCKCTATKLIHVI